MSVDDWLKKRSEIEAARKSAAKEKGIRWHNAIIATLKTLAEAGFCDEQVVGWVKEQSAGRRRKTIEFSDNADGKVGDYSAVRVNKTAFLPDGALLRLLVETEQDGGVLSYAIGLQGKSAQGPWYARICLDPEQRGQGPCGHPLLHCHVGLDPEHALSKDDVRVPLPWLTPVEAIEWLFAAVEPRLEPH